jgi:adenylate kinase
LKAIVLFGSPGSGKGTQAKVLRQRRNIPHISTGDMLRDSFQRGTEEGRALAALMHAGSLVPDEVVNKLVRERLSQPDAAAGFILDGYPRTRAQAEHLCGWLACRGMGEVVIHLAVDYNIIIARLTGRRQCPRCGTLYNIVSQPPKVAGLCDRDGEKLVIREDDSEAVIRERLDEYERRTRPVLDFYRSAGKRLIEVDGSSEPPEVIAGKICQAIDSDDRAKDVR